MERRCPCCGYYTLVGSGSKEYDICPVCYWENDPWQASNPEEADGANAVSLQEARNNFATFGACEERWSTRVRKPYGEEVYAILNLKEIPERLDKAAQWFHSKWGVPVEAYVESMRDAIKAETGVPDWYVAVDTSGAIIGGAGIIENDFHDRPDLAPNLCALYVEPSHRNLGIAGALLRTACEAMKETGRAWLYLITNHTSFYERYGWEYYDMVNETYGDTARIYRKRL